MLASNFPVKRSVLEALQIGAILGVLIIVARAIGVLLPIEEGVKNAFTGGQAPARSVGWVLQSALVLFLSCSVVWLVLTSSQKKQVSLVLGILGLELILLTWICLLGQVFFQPVPSLLALGLAIGAGHGYATVMKWRRQTPVAKNLFTGRLSEEQLARIDSGEIVFEAKPKSYETTAVVCDIANKHDLAEECPPALLAEITDKFIRHVRGSFLRAGAYIEAITGEGVVAVFGFPGKDSQQAEKATRHALSLLESFEKMRDGSKDDSFQRMSVHVGISSGTSIVLPMQQGEEASLFSMGEPIELARRFCIANRFYGSRILIGPETFELASKSIVARPIDFLSGVDERERHEVYEPLKLATEASPEEIARRDSFWNGVVLYREKRWAEAYSQFQKARGPNERDDAPLQLYVRRLQPLAVQLEDSPLK